MNNEILPCPFCGSDDLRQVIHDLSEDDQEPFGYSISCNICFVDLPPEPTPSDSIRTWNTRADKAAPVERIEGLSEALACLDDDTPQYTYNLIVQFKEKYKCMPNVKFQEAARAYLKLQGGE